MCFSIAQLKIFGYQEEIINIGREKLRDILVIPKLIKFLCKHLYVLYLSNCSKIA